MVLPCSGPVFSRFSALFWTLVLLTVLLVSLVPIMGSIWRRLSSFTKVHLLSALFGVHAELFLDSGNPTGFQYLLIIKRCYSFLQCWSSHQMKHIHSCLSLMLSVLLACLVQYLSFCVLALMAGFSVSDIDAHISSLML